VYLRKDDLLRRVHPTHGFVSPRLGIRFDLYGPEMAVFAPDGRRFLSFEELQAERDELQAQRDRERQRSARLAELSRKARRQQASREELREREGLEDEAMLNPGC